MPQNLKAYTNYFLWCFVLLVLLSATACDEGSTGTDEKAVFATIESVTYVNKVFGPGHLGSNFATYTVDFNINMSEPVQSIDIKRIVIFSDRNGSGLGWEIQDQEDIEVSSNRILLQNLVVSNPGQGDSRFDVSIEWMEADSSSSYQFIHKDIFPSLLNINTEWYDQQNLRLTITNTSNTPDSGRIHWLDNDTEVGFSGYTEQNFTGNVLSTDEVPNTANAYYFRSFQEIYGIKTEVITRSRELPERIPPNVSFIEGADLNSGIELFSRVLSDNNTFVVVAGREDWSYTEDPVLFVIDAFDKTLIASYQLEGRVTSLHVSNGFAYVGYETGIIREIELDTGSSRTVATLDDYPQGLILIENWLLASARIGNDEQVLSIHLDSAKVIHSNYFDGYAPYHFVYSPTLKKGFSDRGGISPQDIIAFDFDEETGLITNARDSQYHGDYPIRGPFVLTPDHSMIVTSEGTVFTTGSAPELEYVSRYQYQITDLIFNSENQRTYTIRSTDSKLDVYNLETREHLRAVSLPGSPQHLIFGEDQLTVLMVMGDQFKRVAVIEFTPDELEPVAEKPVKAIRVKPISRNPYLD